MRATCFVVYALGMYRIRIPVSSKIPLSGSIPVSGRILPDNLPDNILVFEIGETGVKTLERELKSCLTGLTSRAFICRLPDLFQFYLNQ